MAKQQDTPARRKKARKAGKRQLPSTAEHLSMVAGMHTASDSHDETPTGGQDAWGNMAGASATGAGDSGLGD